MLFMKNIIITSGFIVFCLLSHSVISETLRISPEQLKQQLSDKNIIILDARSTADYSAGHIEGALSFSVNLTYNNKSINGKISQPAITQKYFVPTA